MIINVHIVTVYTSTVTMIVTHSPSLLDVLVVVGVSIYLLLCLDEYVIVLSHVLFLSPDRVVFSLLSLYEVSIGLK